MRHDIDPFIYYCRKCGAAKEDIARNGFLCVEDDSNVLGISHIVRRKRLLEILRKHDAKHDSLLDQMFPHDVGGSLPYDEDPA